MKRRMICGVAGMMTVMAVFAGCGSDTGETGASDAQAVGDTAETDAETAEDTVLRVLEINMDEDKTVTISFDGTDVADGQDRVTQDVYDDLERAIGRAEEALESSASPEVLDYQVYLLYFALNGSGDDIGAEFAGFDYDGFDNRLNGAAVEKADSEGEGQVGE